MDCYCVCPNCKKQILTDYIGVVICPICGTVFKPKKIISQKGVKNKNETHINNRYRSFVESHR